MLFNIENKNEHDYCEIYGSMLEVDQPQQADFLVYKEQDEYMANIIVFIQNNKLYANSPGFWHFTNDQFSAKYKIYFTNNKQKANFSIYITEYESFVECK